MSGGLFYLINESLVRSLKLFPLFKIEEMEQPQETITVSIKKPKRGGKTPKAKVVKSKPTPTEIPKEIQQESIETPKPVEAPKPVIQEQSKSEEIPLVGAMPQMEQVPKQPKPTPAKPKRTPKPKVVGTTSQMEQVPKKQAPIEQSPVESSDFEREMNQYKEHTEMQQRLAKQMEDLQMRVQGRLTAKQNMELMDKIETLQQQLKDLGDYMDYKPKQRNAVTLPKETFQGQQEIPKKMAVNQIVRSFGF